jgi:hypothetical protein
MTMARECYFLDEMNKEPEEVRRFFLKAKKNRIVLFVACMRLREIENENGTQRKVIFCAWIAEHQKPIR